MVSIARLANDRDGVADHRAHLRHKVGGLFEVEAIAPGVVLGDLLPTVVDRRRIPAPQL